MKPLTMTPTARHGLAEVILQIQRDQQARGFVGLTAQDLAAEQNARQEEEADYEQRCEDLWSHTYSGVPT